MSGKSKFIAVTALSLSLSFGAAAKFFGGEESVLKTDSLGNQKYWLDNQLHRDGQPAVITKDGTKEWYQHGKRHREDGPAIEWSTGDKAWYVDGEMHRTDGAALELTSGKKGYYLYGQPISEQQHGQWKSLDKEEFFSAWEKAQQEQKQKAQEIKKQVMITLH